MGLSLAAIFVPLALNPKPLIRGIRVLRRSAGLKGFLSSKMLLFIYVGASVGLVMVI